MLLVVYVMHVDKRGTWTVPMHRVPGSRATRLMAYIAHMYAAYLYWSDISNNKRRIIYPGIPLLWPGGDIETWILLVLGSNVLKDINRGRAGPR